MLDWHDVFSIIMLILMLGMNLGIKLYFKNRNDQLRTRWYHALYGWKCSEG